MLSNKPLIESVIKKREDKNDPVIKFATRNKASPLNHWGNFKPFCRVKFNKVYNLPIDGIKLKFRYTELTINGRHSPH